MRNQLQLHILTFKKEFLTKKYNKGIDIYHLFYCFKQLCFSKCPDYKKF